MIPKFIKSSKLYIDTIRDFGECTFDKKYIYSKDHIKTLSDLRNCLNSCQFFMVNCIPVMIYDFLINTSVSNKKLFKTLNDFKQMKQYQELVNIVKTRNDDNFRAVQKQVLTLAAKTCNIKLLKYSFENKFPIDKNVLYHCANNYGCLKLIIVNYIDDMVKFIKNRTNLSLTEWTHNALIEIVHNDNLKGFKLLFEHVIKNRHIQKKFNVKQEIINRSLGIRDDGVEITSPKQHCYYKAVFKNKNYNFFKYLVDNGIKIGHDEINNFQSPQMLKYFLSRTINCNIKTILIEYQLQISAVRNDNIELLKYLNSHNINIDIECIYDKLYITSSLTWLALIKGSIKCLKYMIENGFKSLNFSQQFKKIIDGNNKHENILECLKYIYPSRQEVTIELINRCIHKNHKNYLLKHYSNRHEYITDSIIKSPHIEIIYDFDLKFYDKQQIELLIISLVKYFNELYSFDAKRGKKISRLTIEKIKYIHTSFSDVIDIYSIQDYISNSLNFCFDSKPVSMKFKKYLINRKLELYYFFTKNGYKLNVPLLTKN